MEIFVIVQSESINFSEGYTIFGAYKSREQAEEAFREVVQGRKSDYKTEIDKGWITEESSDSFEVWEDGYYAENHCSIWITTTELSNS